MLARWEQTKPKSARRKRSIRRWTIFLVFTGFNACAKNPETLRQRWLRWTTLGPVVDKVYEEIDEVMSKRGRLLSTRLNWRRKWGTCVCHGQSGSSFRDKSGNRIAKANEKFERRFREVERIVAARDWK